MTAFALKRRLGPGGWGAKGWLAVALTAVWTPLAAQPLLGFPSLPAGASGPATLALVAIPAWVIGSAVLGRGPAPRPLPQASGWFVLVICALIAAILVTMTPLIALAIPAVMVSGLVCARYPAAATVGLLVLTGSFNTLEAFTPLPSVLMVDLVLAGLWSSVAWTYLLAHRERPIWLWPGVVISIAYLALSVGAMLGAETLMGGLRAFRSTGWYMLAFLLVGYAGWSRLTYERMARGFVAVAALVGGYATFRWLGGASGKETALALAGNGKYEIVNGDVRLFGSFSSGKELAAWTAVFIPFCLSFALTFTGRWRILAAAGTILCTVGLLGSEARAGFVGAVAGVALVLVLYQLCRGVPGLHLGLTAAAVIGILATGVFLFTQTAGDDEAGVERYTVLVTAPTTDASYQARIFKWRSALDQIENHPFGQGLGSAGVRSSRFAGIGSQSIDSSYLKIAFEQGMAVMVLFVIALLLLLGGLARRAVFTLDRHRAGLGIGGAAALLSFAVMMFSGVFVIGLTALAAWLLVGLGVSQFASPEPTADLASGSA